jgi:hypothetical protein
VAQGPQTAQAKRKVSQNARKHGFRAASPNPTPAEELIIQVLINQFAKDFPAKTSREKEILQQLAVSFHQLQKLTQKETTAQVQTDPETAAQSLFTLATYRERHESRFYKAINALQTFRTNNARQIPKT